MIEDEEKLRVRIKWLTQEIQDIKEHLAMMEYFKELLQQQLIDLTGQFEDREARR